MLFTNSTQLAVLALMLFVGFLFGLAAHPGGRKWKQSYREQEALVRERDSRIATLERENATLASEAERQRQPVAAPAAVPAAAAAAWPATGAGTDGTVTDRGDRRRWFDWGDQRRVN